MFRFKDIVQGKAMYGDLVNAMTYTAFLPVYVTQYFGDPSEGARMVNLSFAWTAIFSWISWFTNDPRASSTAMLGLCCTLLSMNLYQWPHEGEVVIVPQFLWTLLIVSANMPLSFEYKASFAVMGFITAVIVTIRTPLLEAGEALPVLLGATVIHVLFHYYNAHHLGGMMSAHVASLVLAGAFAFHTSSELVTMLSEPGYASIGGFSILRAGFFAAVGLAAAGAFRREISLKERAEQAAEREAMLAEAMHQSMYTLSHELRTPLQGIMGMTSILLEDSSLPTDATESMAVVMTSSRLLLTLINNILDVRKTDAGMMDDFHLSPISLSRAMSEASDYIKAFASINGVKLDLQLKSARGIMIESNALRFQQVMINLLSNAVKYSEAGSAVTVTCDVVKLGDIEQTIDKALAAGCRQSTNGCKDSDSSIDALVVVVSVSDQGPGIDQSQADRVFREFSQLTDDKSKDHNVGQPSGTGLGLNLCLKFISRMKGRIWVNNSKDRGCSFSFYLPVASVDEDVGTAETPGMFPERERDIDACRQAASKYRVLVVDDSTINRKVLDKMLQRTGVAKVVTAESGKQALKILQEDGDDLNLVLTDLQMPGMSGIELTKAIRSSRPEESLVIVGLTAEVNDSVYEECIESGMAHVLSKPVTATQMEAFYVDFSDQIR